MNIQKITSDFNNILKEVEKEKILLPDFQRQFEWTDINRQKKLAATVLCKMPLGSILLLDAPANEFAAKRIGSNHDFIDTSKNLEKVLFLLDGQQRITVLTNVFSDLIHFNSTKLKSLKRRFFLKIPKETHKDYDKNYFGFNNLVFKLGENKYSPEEESPDITSNDMAELVTALDIKATLHQAYIPGQTYDNIKLLEECKQCQDGYLVPLFLLGHMNDAKITNLRRQTLSHIINGIVKNKIEVIKGRILNCTTKEKKIDIMKQFIVNQTDPEMVLPDGIKNDAYEQHMKLLSEQWIEDFRAYLNSCLQGMDLHLMLAPDSSRAKAIEVFENLNRGGVQLNAFDLMLARVAQENRNFYSDFIEEINRKGSYNLNAIERVKCYYNKFLQDNKIDDYSATKDMECYDKEGKTVRFYREAFLNILGLCCNNPEFKSSFVKCESMRDKSILNIEPKKINANFRNICMAIDRASFFFKTRCGIRKLKEINYKLMLTVVGYLFMNDKWYSNNDVHDCLEAWYWSSVFSGHYDKDQNTAVETDIRMLIDTFNKKNNANWIRHYSKKILAANGFSDVDFLVFKDYKQTEKSPKEAIGNYLCQYFLSDPYVDMLNDKVMVNVFMNEAEKLEKHHIIPLASATVIRESNKKLRNRKDSYNSPLNYVYITPETNKAISNQQVMVYMQNISNMAYSALGLHVFQNQPMIQTIQEVERVLRDRHREIQGNIQARVHKLLVNWD